MKNRLKLLRRGLYNIIPFYKKISVIIDITRNIDKRSQELKKEVNLLRKSIDPYSLGEISKKVLGEFKIGDNILTNNGTIFFKDSKDRFVPAHEALLKFTDKCTADHLVLDLGCGKDQVHSDIMRSCGVNVKTCDLDKNSDFSGFYEEIEFKEKFDAIWCSHTLEHVLNPHGFLVKIRNDIKEGGILSITVPPLKHNIVGGHVNLFNAGLLLYRMILAGFDCSNCEIKKYGYNISIIMEVKTIQDDLPQDLSYDIGDIEKLQKYFPFEAKQSFYGDFDIINWK